MSDRAVRPNTSSIPQEIWIQVFSYLPLEDRKNVRLTCHRFYDACSTYQLQSNEELVFEGNFAPHRIQSLHDTTRKVWNIKLCKTSLEDDSVIPFFEKHGANVHSLTLVNCDLKKGILRSILEPCKNLRSFAFIWTKDSLHRKDFPATVFPAFEVLHRRGIVFSEVTDLTMQLWSIVCSAVTNKSLFDIFSIFPNIKKLNLSVIHGSQEQKESDLISDVTSDKIFSMACIYHHLMKIRHQLEELSLDIRHFWNSSLSVVGTLGKISSIEMRNLKTLASNCYILNAGQLSFNIQHLTSLECVMPHDGSSFAVSTTIQLILNTATRLQSLTAIVMSISSYNQVGMSQECFVALVKSKLKTLNIRRCYDLNFHPDKKSVIKAGFEPSSLDDSLSPNYTLNNLLVETDDTVLTFLFSKYFLRLENMVVQKAEEDVLYNIFNHQTKLRSLVLHHCERKHYYRILRKNNQFGHRLRNLQISSPSQLDNLTSLHILDISSFDLSLFVLSKFALSKLKSLTIRMELEYPKTHPESDALWPMMEKLTQLEELEICWNTVTTFDQWSRLFHKLPKLRRFYCAEFSSTSFDDAEYRQLFSNRSALRSVRHNLKEISQLVGYVYNILTNTIEFSRMNLQWPEAYPLAY